MFINSIFLPKTISDQTIPEGISSKIGNFSHLFSNVFHIVKDEQENSLPVQLTNLIPESTENTQNELLNVSLLSDSKSTIESTNISIIVSAFLSKLSPGEYAQELSDINKVKVNEKIPKYFSLSKNDFIKELKSIIESLKSGGTKNSENVEISLIANGQSIKINPLTTNVVDLENWVNEQTQSNSDFEIQIKSTQKKTVVDVEPVNNEILKTNKPVEIISVSSNGNIEAETKFTVDKSVVETTTVLKNTLGLDSASQQPLEDLKQTFVTVDEQTIKTEIPTLTNQIKSPIISLQNNQGNAVSKLLPNSSPKINLELNEKVKINQTITGKAAPENISNFQKDLKSSLISETQNGLDSKTEDRLVPKLETSINKENILSDSRSLNLKKVSSEKSIETTSKVLSNETNIKQNILSSDETTKSIETVKQTPEKNINSQSQSDKKISIKTNQKFNSVSTNKIAVQDKISINDLIEKTEVKEIDVKVQKFAKTNNTNTLKTQNEHQPRTISINDSFSKTNTPVVNAEVKKANSNNQEVKQTSVSKTLVTEYVKTEKTFNNMVDGKPIVTKTILNPKIIDTAHDPNTPKSIGQRELFAGNEVLESEQVDLPKTESTKTSFNSKQTIKENLVSETVGKINVEKKDLEQIKTSPIDSLKQKTETNVGETSKKSLIPETKTEQGPVEIKSNPLKPVIENKLVENEKVDLPKTETTKTSLYNKQTIKENLISEPVGKINVEKKDLEQIKTSPIDSLKQKTETNVGETSKRSSSSEIKIEQKPVEFKSSSQISEDETIEPRNTNPVKENVKEIISVKSNTGSNSKETEKTELNSNNNSEKTSKYLKERTVLENLKTSLEDIPNDDVKHESVTKNQFESKNVKVDLMQRRVYSQIPPLEILADIAEVKNIKNPVLNVDTSKDENLKSIDEPVKSTSNAAESKPKNEKHVWVKVSLEKNDSEVVSEVKKSTLQLSKITIDTNNDGMKKESEQNNFSEKESHEFQKSKPQTVSVETSKNTEQKPAVQNQTTTNQQDLVSNVKPEIKTEQNPFKSTLHSEETRFTSRAAEMVEKIKVISSGEMIREVYKVFESGEKQSIVLKLVPKELGSIKIVLDTIDNVLSAKVEVENETVGHVIRNNVEHLKQSLLQSGVNVNSISISYHSTDQKQNGFNNQKRKNPSYIRNNDVEEVDETIITKKMGYNTYEFLA
jgi:hypothetical protein